MPELPEVESTRRDLARAAAGRTIAAVTVRDRRLRWPVPAGLARRLAGQEVREVRRRAKYLLIGVGQRDAARPSRDVGKPAAPRCADGAATP